LNEALASTYRIEGASHSHAQPFITARTFDALQSTSYTIASYADERLDCRAVFFGGKIETFK
jgi:hypothetical protein